MTVNADGTFDYVPDPDFFGTDSFTYRLEDPSGAVSAIATVTITVNPVNDAPVATDDNFTTDEDTTLNVVTGSILDNDVDVDDALVITQLSDTSNGALTLNPDGTFEYVPDADFFGVDTFTYQLEDPSGATSAVATVTITVNPVNDAPIATDDNFTTGEDTTLNVVTGSILDNDVDVDDALVITQLSDTSNGALTLNPDGTFDYVPDADFSGVDTFTYQLEDPSGATSAIATVTITVNPVNDAPVAVDDSYFSNEDIPFTASLNINDLLENDSDLDGDTLTVNMTPVSPPANGTVSLNANGTFTYTPNANFNGTDSFIYEVSDGNGGTAEATVNISVIPVNDAPVAVDDNFTTDEDTTLNVVTGGILDNDSDLDSNIDTLVITELSSTSNGALTLNPDGTFEYVPDPDFFGTDSFTYQLEDPSGATSAVATVTITVNPINDAPTTTPVVLSSIAEDSPTRLITQAELLANAGDIDNDNLTASGLTITAGNGTLVDNGDGTWTYTPSSNDNTDVSFTYNVTDGTDNVASTATLDITPVNDAPTTTNPVVLTSIAEDSGPRVITQAELLVNASDIEGDALTVNDLAIAAGNGTLIDNGDGTWTFTPANNDDSNVRFAFTITDGTNNVASTATLDITPVNDAPNASDDSFTIIEDTQLVIAALGLGVTSNDDTDDSSSELTAIKLTDPTNGTVELNPDGTFTYTPNPNFNGSDSFTYQVTDSSGASDTATVRIDVSPVNDAPVALDDSFELNEGGSIVFGLTNNDFDIDGNFTPNQTTVNIVTGPTNGTAFIDADGNLNYEHDGTETSTDNIVYQIIDQGGLVDTATVTITVQPIDDPTILQDDDLGTINFGEQLIISPMDILINDADVDSEFSLENIRIVTQPDQGTVDIRNGQLIFTPEDGAFGDIEFEYLLEVDGRQSETARASARVTPPLINVAPVNNEPVVEETAEPEPTVEEQTEEEEEEVQLQGRVVSNESDDDDLIELGGSSAVSNDIFDNRILESVDSLENSASEILFTSQYAGATYSYASRLNDISLLNLTGTVIAEADKVSEFEATYLAGLVWDDLDSAKQSYLLNRLQIGVPTIVSSAASFLTVGYLAWVIRGGVLLTTFMSSVPAWSSFDILSVIDEAGGDESIEEIVDQ